MDNDHIPVYSTKSKIQKIRNRRHQYKTGTKASKQKPPPYEKKRTPDMGVRPGAQEDFVMSDSEYSNCGKKEHVLNSGEYDLNRRYPIPKFLKTNTNVTVHVGETASLLCSIENLGTRAVVWRHLPDVTPLTVKKYVFTNDDKIRIEHEFESQDWRLIISNVQKTNAGEYECQVASRDISFRQQFYLNVLDAVSDKKHYVVEAINIYGPEHVNTGESFEVHCNATGVDFPPDEIDWFINGFKIKTDFDRGVIMDKSVSLKTKSIESTIHIEHARMEDAGDYTCRVSTGLVKTTEVKVLYMDKNNNSKRGMLKLHTNMYMFKEDVYIVHYSARIRAPSGGSERDKTPQWGKKTYT
ncbi:hypothetical protein FSP39_003252 [Pinctada imbricata]|uniref:Ig-like domain-containing protein n=1 Tax=Pinctada imbricata TaxID=66713 RepID=A0AA88YH50_PINIB|nr:hypothetical protein FSP39_003252 [Pinctada imbricata]